MVAGLLTPFFLATSGALLGCMAAMWLRRAPIDEVAVHWLMLVFACTFLYALVVLDGDGFTWPFTLLLPLAAPLLARPGSENTSAARDDEQLFYLVAGIACVVLACFFGWGLATIADELIHRGMDVIPALSVVFMATLAHALAGLLALRACSRMAHRT